MGHSIDIKSMINNRHLNRLSHWYRLDEPGIRTMTNLNNRIQWKYETVAFKMKNDRCK